MKKILSALVFIICILSVNFCSADLLEYYQNHPDYKVYAGRMGSYAAVYLPSVHVQEYNPPHYQIGFNQIRFIADVYKKGTKESTDWIYNCSKRYNWHTKESFSLQNGNWVKDDVDPNHGMTGLYNRSLANALFRAAYGMDFYSD